MKIYTKGTALAAAAVFALATAAPAIADHDTVGVEYDAASNVVYIDCETFGGLEYTLDKLVFFASDDKGQYRGTGTGQDRLGLEDKLTNAHDKLHEDPPKPCDAAQKLNDFSFKVQSLLDGNTADKTKISDDQGGESIRCLIEGSAALAQSLSSGESCGDAGSPPRGKGPKK